MKSEAKELDTRERILEVGAQAIAAKSFSACGLAEILAAAKVPKGSFYHYFESKEDFGVALIEKEIEEYLEILRPIAGDRKKPALKRLREIFDVGREECVANGAARQCLVPKMALETSQLSETVHAAVKCAYDHWTAVLEKLVREGQAAGEITRDYEAERLAGMLVMLWEGATIRMQIDRSLQPVDDCMDFIFKVLLPVRRS